MKLRIVSTHPIQYQVPWFRKLATLPDLDFKVYYGLLPNDAQQGVGFDVPFQWDIPLLDGYEYTVLPNERRTPNLKGFFASSTPDIYERLAQDRAEAVIITGWNALPLIQAWRACERLKIPKIMRGESNALKPRSLFHRLAHGNFLRRFDAFLAIGKSNRDFYLQNGILPERIFDCPYFVDNERFKKQAEAERPFRQRFRTAWGTPESSVCFLFVGKLQPKKRIFDLVKAVAIAMKVNQRVHLLVVGTGGQMDEAKQMVTAAHLPVSFAGFLNQTEITRAYVAADCLVLPSDYGETWGLVVNEAMACGLPAIVSDRVGCGPDLIKDGITGAIFPFGDVQALAQKIIELCAVPQKLLPMGNAVGQLIARYSVENATKTTIAALEYLIPKRASMLPL